MRLIDADAKALNPETINGIDFDTAIKEVEAFLNSDECKYPLHIYLCAVRDFAEWYRDELKEAPTIDAVPVVRGEWVVIGMRPTGTKDTHYCSICKAHGRKEMNYCPNCGAKMESEGST
jgi:hypothetical protein